MPDISKPSLNADDSLTKSSKSTEEVVVNKRLPVWVWIATVLVVVFDQFTKWVVLKTIPFGEVKPVLPFLSFTLTFNSGAAFSFLASSGGWQRYLFTVVAIVVSIWLVQELKKTSIALQQWGLLLILGGALGNLYDRIAYGHVVDFILVHWQSWSFSVFNIADSAISIGVALLIMAIILDKTPIEKS
ncbi:MAG: signal peptidase II [Pseudomonadota bacterium]